MKGKVVLFLLILIVGLGIFLRFYKLPTNFIFDIDQSEDLYKLRGIARIVSEGEFTNLPLKGEPGTYLIGDFDKDNLDYPVYTGVFYFYFLLPFAILSNFEPFKLTAIFAIFNIASIVISYFVGKELFNKRVGVIFALLMSTSFWMNFFSRAIWTPSPTPLFTLLSLLFLAKIKKGETSYWPLFLFFVSGLSQIHNSGYYFLFLFLILPLVLRLKLPKSFKEIALSILGFLIPIFPTIVYEFMTGFKLFPETFRAMSIQLADYAGSAGSVSLPEVFWLILRDFFGFWVTTLNALQFNPYFGESAGSIHGFLYFFFIAISIFSILSIFTIKGKNNWIKTFFITFCLTFLIIPFAAKRYYADTSLGLFFGPATFSMYAAMPIVLMSISYFLNLLFQKGLMGKATAVLYITFLSLVNILTIKHYIWENNDIRFNYSDKLDIVKFIKSDTDSQSYSLAFSDPDYDGFEFIYLLDKEKIERPVSYNGKKTVYSLMAIHKLSEGVAKKDYLIVGEPNWEKSLPDMDYELVFEKGRFKVYRLIFN